MALSDGVAWAEVPQSAGNTASAGLLSLVPFLLIFLIYYIFFMRRHSVPAILPLKAMFLNKVRGFSQRLDARGGGVSYQLPIVPRNVENPWVTAEKSRDALHDSFEDLCKCLSINAVILKSPNSHYPPWVKFECWAPKDKEPTLVERVLIQITIHPTPYRRFPFTFYLEWSYGETLIYSNSIVSVDPPLIEQILYFVLGRGPKPKLRRTRNHFWEVWKVENKFVASRIDILAILGPCLNVAAIGFWLSSLVLCVQYLDFYYSPHSVFDQVPTSYGNYLIAACVMTLAGGAMWVIGGRISNRRCLVRNQGKPCDEPRDLVRVDSWQTVIFDMAKECQAIRNRFLETIAVLPTTNFRYSREHVWHWGIDGPEEREQIVFSSGRGLVFCLIYTYGNDLYVGWDGHLNRGQWIEKTIKKGIDKQSGEPTSFKVVEPGIQGLTEYDVTDLSCLMEWTHAQLVRLLKRLIDEKKIDQEIDFKILRGERQKLTMERTETKESSTSRLFQRTQ